MKIRYIAFLYTLLIVTAIPLIQADEPAEQAAALQDEVVVHLDLDDLSEEDDALAGLNFEDMPDRPLLKETITIGQAFNLFKSYIVMECTMLKDSVVLHLKNNKKAYIITAAVTGTAAVGALGFYLWYINNKGA
jgi:hypothetical protein